MGRGSVRVPRTLSRSGDAPSSRGRLSARTEGLVDLSRDKLLWMEQKAALVGHVDLSQEDLVDLGAVLAECVTRERGYAQHLLRRVLESLGTWQAFPEARSEYLRFAIADLREQLAVLFEDSPSLRFELKKQFGSVLDSYEQELLARGGVAHFPIGPDPSFEDCIDPTYLPGFLGPQFNPERSSKAQGRAELSQRPERSSDRMSASVTDVPAALVSIRGTLTLLMERLIQWYKQAPARTPQRRSEIQRLRYLLQDYVQLFPSWEDVSPAECRLAFDRAWSLYVAEYQGGFDLRDCFSIAGDQALLHSYFPEELPSVPGSVARSSPGSQVPSADLPLGE